MHNIYKIISAENDKKEIKEKNNNSNKNETNIVVVTQNKQKEVMQIIYFDFDDSGISDVSRNTLIDFLDKNKKELSRYIILGHTDTKGTSDYNINLSLKRAQAVKEILINQGISDNSISLLGKGENELAVNTPDETKHPANRRAEVKIIN